MLRGFYDIHKFHLYWEDRQTDKILYEYLNAWILVALNCNVQDLSIQIEVDENNNYSLETRFPHFLFNSQSLSKLVLKMTLNYESKVILPKSMDLPRLKFMSLGSFFVEDGDSINKLISGCPILESLILRDIWIEDGYEMNVNIESHELKHLEIINNNLPVRSHYNMAKIIKLSAPNLTSFICKDYMLQEYSLENVSSLITADIEIVREGEYEALEYHDLEISEEEKEILYPKRTMEFIKAFHNVKDLTISSPRLLQVKFRADKDDDEVALPMSSIMFHLKHIEIRELKGCDAEIKSLELLLMKAPVLEEMVLSLDKSSSPDIAGSPDRLQVAKKLGEKLRSLSRASPSLAMIFL
ncbi:putative F-box/LRR-repeat protein At3g59160 isoform X2 [Papaver somniferum]|uniref:putative F-box/LRR-repeat protein At3g59160 isoform X2 n=1 Tax=Papaver somniferum TaxID=3469 RepID=UPI000E6FC781|nr:putative F-box/LRR-repeat protein At3g59160 isoform X2 [Papaver somniferum]